MWRAFSSSREKVLPHLLSPSYDIPLLAVRYVQEFLWTRLQPSEDARVVLVLDLAGLGFNIISNGEVVKIIKGCVAMTSAHYPARSHKMIIINVPTWFHMLFAIVKGLLNDAQKAKINVFKKSEVLNGLRQFIDDDNIPKEYGGSSPVPLGQMPNEQALRCCVMTRLDELGEALYVDDALTDRNGEPATTKTWEFSLKFIGQ